MTRASKGWNFFAAIFLALETCALAADFDFNYGTQIWNVAEAREQVHAIGWYQADFWHKDYQLVDGSGLPVDISDTNVVIAYDVIAVTNLQETWIAATGVVVNGTGGQVRLNLNSYESNISTGYYWGLVHAATWSGTNLIKGKLLIRQSIEVKFSTDSRFYARHGPLTYPSPSVNASSVVGRAYSLADPSIGQAYIWDGTNMVPGNPAADPTGLSTTGHKHASADLTDTPASWLSDFRVVGIIYTNTSGLVTNGTDLTLLINTNASHDGIGPTIHTNIVDWSLYPAWYLTNVSPCAEIPDGGTLRRLWVRGVGDTALVAVVTAAYGDSGTAGSTNYADVPVGTAKALFTNWASASVATGSSVRVKLLGAGPLCSAVEAHVEYAH